MNNRGFTLVELLAVIALLTIVSSIGYFSISSIISANRNNECKYLAENIKSAVEMYASDNRYNNEFTKNINKEITVKDLIDNNYLKSPIINPYTKSEMLSDKIIITINFNSDYTVSNISLSDENINPINFSCNGE